MRRYCIWPNDGVYLHASIHTYIGSCMLSYMHDHACIHASMHPCSRDLDMMPPLQRKAQPLNLCESQMVFFEADYMEW
jgi:hypothetical protein